MRLRELIFQGALGADRPTRLRPDASLAHLDLPEGVSVTEIHDLLVACLYPTYLGEEQSQRLAFGDSFKLAAVLETERGVFRVVRRADADGVRLQRKHDGGYEDLISGAQEVETALQEKLDLPRIEIFFPLHLWRFDADELPAAGQSGALGGDDRIPELKEQYLTALEVEDLEDELKELEVRVEESKKALGQGAKIEDKLRQARQKLDEIAVDEMSDEEIELLETKEEKFDEFRSELGRLRSQEDTELEQINRLIPESPIRMPKFWGGIVVAVVALVASFLLHETHRILALAAIPGLAVTGIVLLQYFNNLGRASLHKVRLASIRRRINQIRESEILYRERIDHMLLHAGVENEEELQQRIPKAAKLRKMIEKLDEKATSIQRDPEYRKAREEVDSLQERLEELREQRQELPSFVMNSFQLENDLETLGVDPVEVRQKAESDAQRKEQNAGQDEVATPLGWLQSVAQWTGQWNETGLKDKARSMWSKICGHVLSDRFDKVDLTPEGELVVESLTAEQLELWQKTRTSEVHAVLSALALALHVSGSRDRGERAFSSVWIGDPGETMTPGHADKFSSVFKSAAKNSQIVICRTKR